MTENTNVIIKGKESKLLLCINEKKDINVTSKNQKSSVKKKGECNMLRYQKKKNVKQQTKPKNKCQKATEKLSALNVLSKYNKKAYEHQIQQLNLMLKQSLKHPTLTQDELNMLFMKYKSDGHYRANEHLPSFTNFLNKTHSAINGNRQFYDRTQFVSDTEEINSRNVTSTNATPYFNVNNENQPIQENLSVYKYIEPSLKDHQLKTTENPETTNMENRIKNKCLYVDENPLYNNNYNHMLTNHDIQIYNNINVLGDIQNFSQSKSDLNVKNISEREDHSSCNFANTQNTVKEHYNYRSTNKNLLYNIFESNLQCENLNNSAILQPNDTYSTVPYNDLSLNPDFCNDICLNKWNIDNNNNNQSCKNVYSACIPQTNDLKSCYNVNNSVTTSQMTLIKNYFQNENNFNSSIHTNMYPLINGKEDLVQHFNDNMIMQQDCVESANPNIISDNLPTYPNTFVLSCANVAN